MTSDREGGRSAAGSPARHFSGCALDGCADLRAFTGGAHGVHALVFTACLLLLALPACARPAAVTQEGGRWVVRNAALRVTVDPAAGRIAVQDRRARYTWRHPGGTGTAFRNARKVHGGVAFDADLAWQKGKPKTVIVTLRLPDDAAADMTVETDMADRREPLDNFRFLDPLLPETPDAALAVADYSNGHLYPLTLDPWPVTWLSGDRLDLPFLGLCDLKRGCGYALILETSDDSTVECRPFTVGGRAVHAPHLYWVASQGALGYPRRLRYRFSPKGGYVALAKAYRAHAKTQGLVVPFSEKLKRNPNIRRLFGAPDVWGDASLAFAKQAKAAGVEKMLIHGRSTPQEMKAVAALGYLPSEYDNYTDILPLEPGQEPDSSHDRLPEAAVQNADGSRMKAWLTYDKKTQYMKRCPALWVPAARNVLTKVLGEWPFLGRFIDVTTAEGLYECFDPAHPLTRAQKREAGQALLGAVRARGLVVGGEHGIWWGAPRQDYIEGMMSSYQFAWPAGHLIHPKDRQEKFEGPYGTDTWERYDRYGIGHEYRIPLWELVFHDCVVSTWYWGDASDWLRDADPGNQAKKDAFNVLYGTIPLLWADGGGSWRKDRDAFLRTYRNTCSLHEAIAGTEMLSHEFLTPDHAVQRTRFSDGTVCVVNFGATPRTVTLAGRTHLLPQNGWAVKGPKIEQRRAVEGGTVVTMIQHPGYLSREVRDGLVTARVVSPDRLRLQTTGGWRVLPIVPRVLQPGWDMAGTRIYALDAEGCRLRQLPVGRSGNGFHLISGVSPTDVELVCRTAAKAPDIQVEALAVSPGAPRQGQPLTTRVTVRNAGGSAARKVTVTLYADAAQPGRALARLTVSSLAAGQAARPAFTLDTAPLDGPRRLVAIVTTGETELCALNNRAERAVEVRPDFARWPRRTMLRVEAGGVDRENEPASVRLDRFDGDPASVRVAACDDAGRPVRMVPAQIGAMAEGVNSLADGPADRPSPAGTVAFVHFLPGRLPAGSIRRFVLLSAPRGGAKFLPRRAGRWDADTQTFTGTTYRLRFENGAPVEVGPPSGKPFITHMIYSSAATGWTEEPGSVGRFHVTEDGPVRTVILVEKALRDGCVYRKTYALYTDHFDLTGTVNKGYGVFHRAYYAMPGQYEDSGGFRATLDGQGDAEEVSNRASNPQWYAVYADDWAEACLALAPMTGITYWDNPGAWGGLGFNPADNADIRVRYLFAPGAKDAGFAKQAYRRSTQLLRVTIE